MSLYRVCFVCGNVFFQGDDPKRQCRHCRAELEKLKDVSSDLLARYREGQPMDEITSGYYFQMVERTWSAGGQSEQFYKAVKDTGVPYETFQHLVSGVIIRGIVDGWVDLWLPSADVLHRPGDYAPDKMFVKVEARDPNRLADEIANLFPDVNWDEEIPADIDGEPLPAEHSEAAPAVEQKQPA